MAIAPIRGTLVILLFLTAFLCAVAASAQGPVLLGMGDSVGEGVQSADANLFTQPSSYLSIIAGQAGVPFPLPLIVSNPFGWTGSADGRSRLDPNLQAANLSVSGQRLHELLREQADGVIDAEVDLVLAPRLGTQIEVAESLDPGFIICFVGGNDLLNALTSFDQLNGTQVTPVADFERDYRELMTRLGALGKPVVVANLPDPDKSAFLFDRDDLIAHAGGDYGLPAGSYTTLIEAALLRLGLDDGTNLQDPNWVLDPAEAAALVQHAEALNQVIAAEAAVFDFPVVDLNAFTDEIIQNPPVHAGVTISTRYLGGLNSIDGVHPSNIGHALLANEFIKVINRRYSLKIPKVPARVLNLIAFLDPFVDLDGDRQVRGRPFVGLGETVAFLMGVSGDPSEDVPQGAVAPAGARDILDLLRSLQGGSAARQGAVSKQEAAGLLAGALGIRR
ncbi:MAG: hypothetical protein GC160_26500 [Acidobacteria bacterium]|nr:hypothetical protein [Acidobacteriota bacterium]